jgi:dTDP-4-dehydrorhamnose reductase
MTDSKRTIFVTGAGGQLGSEIHAIADSFSGYRFLFFNHGDLDIADMNVVRKTLNPVESDIIINTAAYTAVDRAEEEAEKADLANHIGPKNLAKLATNTGCLLIHISTDYVFDGESSRPYKENDTTGPLNVYGLTKLKGEDAILESKARAIIIRTSWVYSSFGNNFVKTMLRLGRERDEISVIFEQSGTPTYARDLANTILDIIQRVPPTLSLPQIYHYSNEGLISWYDFAKSIMELGNISCHVTPIEIKDYPLPAIRPVYSVLNKTKIKHDFAINIPYWRDSLRACLEQIKKESK